MALYMILYFVNDYKDGRNKQCITAAIRSIYLPVPPGAPGAPGAPGEPGAPADPAAPGTPPDVR